MMHLRPADVSAASAAGSGRNPGLSVRVEIPAGSVLSFFDDYVPSMREAGIEGHELFLRAAFGGRELDFSLLVLEKSFETPWNDHHALLGAAEFVPSLRELLHALRALGDKAGAFGNLRLRTSTRDHDGYVYAVSWFRGNPRVSRIRPDETFSNLATPVCRVVAR